MIINISEQSCESFLNLEELIVPEILFGVPISEQRQEIAQISSLLFELIPEKALVSKEDLSQWVFDQTPYIVARHNYPWKFRHSLCVLSPSIHNFNQKNFVIEAIKKQLIPDKEVEICSFKSHRFYFKDFTDRVYLLMEVSIHIEDKKSYEMLQHSFSSFSQFLTMGLSSPKSTEYAYSVALQTIPHSTMQSYEPKILDIQKNLNRLIRKFPDVFDSTLLHALGNFIAMTPARFFDLRSPRHLASLVVSQFILRRAIKRNLVGVSDKRHLLLRFLPAKLYSPFGEKKILGLIIALSLFDKHEHFDEEHVLLAIKKWIPNAIIVQGSKYLYRNPQDERLCILYVEIDKESNEGVLPSELSLLKKSLSFELKKRVQKLVPLLFTVRNEELIMKNLIVLSQELKSIHSFPHMMVSFEKQIESSLVFTLIIAYPATYKGIEEKLYSLDPHIEISIDRKDCIGHLDDGTPKEGAVFRLQVAKTLDMLRSDFSVNVNLARKKTVAAISQALGKVRDYDGGLITKQHELFSQFLAEFSTIAVEQNDLLENFFFTLNPIEKQAVLSLGAIKKLFKLVLLSQSKNFSAKGAYFLEQTQDGHSLIVFLRAENHSLKKFVKNYLSKAQLPQKILISNLFNIHDTYCHGFILETLDNERRKIFLDALNQAIKEWQQSIHNVQILHLNLSEDLLSLDPRLGGDSISKSILKMLFSGLTQVDLKGKIKLAVAERVELSPDLKTYTFFLKKTLWSNGSLVKASDFEYAWKSVLAPDFQSLFAHRFYIIKNAKKAKEGMLPIDEVGIYSIDDSTLKIELEHPVPYFLELISHPLFSPVLTGIDQLNPQWANKELDLFVCNGLFLFKKNRSKENYVLEKNPYFYADGKEFGLDQVMITKTNARTALEMFKNDELDWLGGPMRPWESYFEAAESEKNEIVEMGERVFLCHVNVKRWPLANKKLRQALSLAVDRQEIVEVLRDGKVAYSPIPFHESQHLLEPFIKPHALKEMAKNLFEEALEELGIPFSSFPMLYLIYPEFEKRKKTVQLMANQWKKNLGIDVQIQGYNWGQLLKKAALGDYELASSTWSWINNPLFNLNLFTSANEENFSKWENKVFQKLINKAIYEPNAQERNKVLVKAETLLIEESPVIPLLIETTKALKKKNQITEKNKSFFDLFFS